MGSAILRVSQKLFIILVVIIPVLAQQQIPPPKPSPEENATVAIRALNASTNAPIPNVALELRRSPLQMPGRRDLRSWSYNVTTGDDGTASVEVMPDRYQGRSADPLYGVPPGTRATAIKPGDKNAVFIVRLLPAATLSGRIEDDDGSPLRDITVRLLNVTWRAGTRSVAPALFNGRSDEKGRFEIDGVLPGRYVLYATQPLTFAQQKPDRATPYAATFYPNAFDLEAATEIQVLPGVNQPGLRITMPEGHYYTVNGRVEGIPDDVEAPLVELNPMSGAAS